jgi:hypothetical protein
MPVAFVMGDTFDVTLTVPQYTPATASSMTLVLFGSNRYGVLNASVAGTVVGSGWRFQFAGSLTALWTPGAWTYNFQAVETVGGERVTVPGGWFQVQPDPGATLSTTTTHAAQMIALIEARLLNRVPRDLQSFAIAGQSIMKIPIETLYVLREQYREEANAERAELQRQMGQGTKRRILARFTSPSNIPASPFPYSPV